MKLILERSELTDESIDLLIRCAMHGIGYWANSGNYQPHDKTYRVSYIENPDGLPTEVDKLLTFDQIRDAFIELAAAGSLPKWQMVEIINEELTFDATVGDSVFQQAVFGKQVYG